MVHSLVTVAQFAPRNYQRECVQRVLSVPGGRSGIVDIACGGGKTVVAVAIACALKRATLCICTGNESAHQFHREFSKWTSLPESHISHITSDQIDIHLPLRVVFTTYSFLSFQGNRNPHSERALLALATMDWGVVFCDEVHVVPARTIRDMISSLSTSCTIGLTGTLLREDEKVSDIHALIGPVLYRADWKKLQQQGYLATVQCHEIHCPMPERWQNAYDDNWNALHYTLNPNKLKVVEYLVQQYSKVGHRIIIFSDSIPTLRFCARHLNVPFVDGEVPRDEFELILYAFRTHHEVRVICMSKVGDTSLDFPDASVVIQISAHFGSRRQETQRLGRILRPKARKAFFFTLLSLNSREMKYAEKRQQFNEGHGFLYKKQTMAELLPKGFRPTPISRQTEDRLLAVIREKQEERKRKRMKK